MPAVESLSAARPHCSGACCTANSGTHNHGSTSACIGLALRHRLLHRRRQHPHDIGIWTSIPILLYNFKLMLLLRQHATGNNHGQAIDAHLDSVWHVNEALRNANSALGEAGKPNDAVVAGCIHFVKARLNHVTVCTKRKAWTAARFQDNTVPVLWIAKGPTWKQAATAHVRFTSDIQDLTALLYRHAATATASVAELHWCFHRCFEKANVPLTSEGLVDFLWHGHCAEAKSDT
mmetsp:Transcript_51400/g.99344  ORF Transcript_51400/g.99344 Transcript_51400/m.99344 type:complete len:234 (+) Transcript_51400:122-823(+)